MPESRSTRTARSTRRSPLLPLLVAVAAALVLLVTVVGVPGGGDDAGGDAGESAASQSAQQSGDTASGEAGLARRQPDDPMALGDVDAPVVMVAYSDFQCPFCGKFARETLPELEEDYVADGTLRVEWRDFPYLGPESRTAALAGRAAAAQGRFWDFHDALYADQPPPNSGALDQAYVETVARDLGLDLEQFRADMTSELTESRVTSDFQQGQAIGVTGTPSFLINGTAVVGAQPIEVFEQAIEEAAAQ